MDASERKTLIDEFNDSESFMHVLICSLKSSNSGLNLHHCCADVIILCMAENISSLMQALGRIHRLGQKKIQRVRIITLDHSYDQIMQFNQTTKMLQQVAGEGRITIDEAKYQVTPDKFLVAQATAKPTDTVNTIQ